MDVPRGRSNLDIDTGKGKWRRRAQRWRHAGRPCAPGLVPPGCPHTSLCRRAWGKPGVSESGLPSTGCPGIWNCSALILALGLATGQHCRAAEAQVPAGGHAFLTSWEVTTGTCSLRKGPGLWTVMWHHHRGDPRGRGAAPRSGPARPEPAPRTQSCLMNQGQSRCLESGRCHFKNLTD